MTRKISSEIILLYRNLIRNGEVFLFYDIFILYENYYNGKSTQKTY